MDYESAHLPKAHVPQNLWIISFADMIMNVLAFFILLFSLSEITKERVVTTIGSVQEKFRGKAGRPADMVPISMGSDRGVPSKDYVSEAKTLFRESFELTDIEIKQVGNAVRLDFAADALFEVNSLAIRRQRQDLVNRLAKAVGLKEDGFRTELEIRLAAPPFRADGPGIETSPEARRAVALIDALKAKGTQPEFLTIGLDDSVKRGHIAIVFNLQAGDPEWITFDDLLQRQAKKVKPPPTTIEPRPEQPGKPAPEGP